VLLYDLLDVGMFAAIGIIFQPIDPSDINRAFDGTMEDMSIH